MGYGLGDDLREYRQENAELKEEVERLKGELQRLAVQGRVAGSPTRTQVVIDAELVRQAFFEGLNSVSCDDDRNDGEVLWLNSDVAKELIERNKKV